MLGISTKLLRNTRKGAKQLVRRKDITTQACYLTLVKSYSIPGVQMKTQTTSGYWIHLQGSNLTDGGGKAKYLQVLREDVNVTQTTRKGHNQREKAASDAT